jgi:hypothetical protein
MAGGLVLVQSSDKESQREGGYSRAAIVQKLSIQYTHEASMAEFAVHGHTECEVDERVPERDGEL